jgi:ferritin-like metal-binding protein YciE
MMQEDMSPEVNELMHIGVGIKAERYEISAYEGLVQVAQAMEGMEEVVDLLEQNLEEEYQMLERLQEIAGMGALVDADIFEEADGRARSEA